MICVNDPPLLWSKNILPQTRFTWVKPTLSQNDHWVLSKNTFQGISWFACAEIHTISLLISPNLEWSKDDWWLYVCWEKGQSHALMKSTTLSANYRKDKVPLGRDTNNFCNFHFNKSLIHSSKFSPVFSNNNLLMIRLHDWANCWNLGILLIYKRGSVLI